jgi:hypothetical protein
VPVKHGHGGGIGPGMGNAIAVFLPAFTILFLLLILFHLISFFHHHLPDHLGIGVGFSQVIIGTLILGSLLLSRQSYTLLQALYPLTSLIVFSLALSLILGIYLVIRDLRNRHQTLKADSRNVSQFPLPMNRYRNIRPIGAGGVGAIWYAERIGDGTPVVVKVPKKDDELTGKSFMQEMSIWKELEHEHIARLISANILPVPYIEIEYLPRSVADLQKPVPVSKAMKIITGIISALLYAHAKGIIHCDIKPTNILLSQEGIPKLTDWGLAQMGHDRWSVSGFSPTYAAPEQQQAIPRCSELSDIWQIGMVWTELLTGHPTIPRGDEPVFQTETGGGLYRILTRCLALRPSDRYQSMHELSEDIAKLFETEKNLRP